MVRSEQNKHILPQRKPSFTVGTCTLDLANGRAPKRPEQKKIEAKEGRKERGAH